MQFVFSDGAVRLGVLTDLGTITQHVVEKLSRDIGEAQTKGESVPPGVHLHLGYMYFLQGNATAACRELETEKQLFPESTVFVDRLLAKMRAP